MLRVCTWNVRRAGTKSACWDFLHQMSPDILLLQEVSAFPATIASEYEAITEHPITRNGSPQRFSTAVLVRGSIGPRIELTSKIPWIARELERFRGNLLAHEVVVQGLALRVASVYCPAWPVDPVRLAGIDVSKIKLALNPDVWATELLWAALREIDLHASGPWVVAGDLNSSETFDSLWPGGPRGNKEILDRMAAIGLSECLRHRHGRLVPTFRSPRGGKVIHQLDHLFATVDLTECLKTCSTGDIDQVFGGAISDHLPVIADFELRGKHLVIPLHRKDELGEIDTNVQNSRGLPPVD